MKRAFDGSQDEPVINGWADPSEKSAEEQNRRERQRANAKARRSTIDNLHDDGTRIFLDGRIWEHRNQDGWIPVDDKVFRGWIVKELARELEIGPQLVTPRLTSDTLQSFKDCCQPLAAAEIDRLESGEAADLQTGQPVRGTPWLDYILYCNHNGQLQYIRRDRDIWCPRPPIPVEYGDGIGFPPEKTLDFLRRAMTTVDDDSNSPEAKQRADFLMAFIGQILLERSEDQKIGAMTGAGRRGKGTVIRLIQHLTGNAVYEVTSLNELSDRFAMSHLESARVLAITDSPAPDLKDREVKTGVARIKAISGGDKLRVERKHGDARSKMLRTIVVVASNDVPSFATSATDYEAWLGRLRVFEFNGPKPARPIPHFENHLIQADGLRNIALYAVDCYVRLLQGHLTEPKSFSDLRRNVLLDAIDPIERWATERLTRSRTYETSINTLLQDFRQWADFHDFDHDSISSKQLGQQLKAAFPTASSRRQRDTGHQTRYWTLSISKDEIGPKRADRADPLYLFGETDDMAYIQPNSRERSARSAQSAPEMVQ